MVIMVQSNLFLDRYWSLSNFRRQRELHLADPSVHKVTAAACAHSTLQHYWSGGKFRMSNDDHRLEFDDQQVRNSCMHTYYFDEFNCTS